MSHSTTVFVVLLATAFIVSSLGFYRLVWFISVGYGYSIAAMATAVVCLAGRGGSWLLAIQLVLLFAYGVRLGTHVLLRDRNAACRQTARATYGEVTGSLGIKFAIWIAVGPLYVAMFSPAAFHSLHAGSTPILTLAGMIIMAGGLILEAAADWQKSAAKKVAPDRFCDVGLFAWVRCPAYLGEMLFWIGNWVAGNAFYFAWWHWTLSLAGLLCIVLIMLGATKRIEASQQRRYGQLAEFRRYTKTVPILIPWVPLYSVQKLRCTLG